MEVFGEQKSVVSQEQAFTLDVNDAKVVESAPEALKPSNIDAVEPAKPQLASLRTPVKTVVSKVEKKKRY